MTISDRAGLPADPSILVDVDRLLAAYFDDAPDPSVPAQRVAFGTSGHRGSSLQRSFNEAHIVAASAAVSRYRRMLGINGPLFLGRDTHALSEPATRTALEVLVADGVRRPRGQRRRLRPDARPVARDPDLEPRPIGGPGRRHRRHAVPQPARGRRLQVQPAQRRPGRHGRDGLDPGRGQPHPPGGRRPRRARPLRAGARGGPAVRLPGRLRGRPRRGPRHGGDPGVRPAPRRGPPGRGERPLLGGDRRAVRPRPDRGEPGGGPDLRLHDRGLGRPDPDGPLVAPRDGRPRRPARPLRPRRRQRRRRRPPRHRHPGRRAAQPEPLPLRRDRVPVRRRAHLGPRRGRGQDARLVRDDRPRGGRPRPSAPRGPGRLQVVRGRPHRRLDRVRRRGERRRLVPAPRRHDLDHRQGRDHRLPAGRGDDGPHRPRPGRRLRRADRPLRRPRLPAGGRARDARARRRSSRASRRAPSPRPSWPATRSPGSSPPRPATAPRSAASRSRRRRAGSRPGRRGRRTSTRSTRRASAATEHLGRLIEEAQALVGAALAGAHGSVVGGSGAVPRARIETP